MFTISRPSYFNSFFLSIFLSRSIDTLLSIAISLPPTCHLHARTHMDLYNFPLSLSHQRPQTPEVVYNLYFSLSRTQTLSHSLTCTRSHTCAHTHARTQLVATFFLLQKYLRCSKKNERVLRTILAAANSARAEAAQADAAQVVAALKLELGPSRPEA